MILSLLAGSIHIGTLYEITFPLKNTLPMTPIEGYGLLRESGGRWLCEHATLVWLRDVVEDVQADWDRFMHESWLQGLSLSHLFRGCVVGCKLEVDAGSPLFHDGILVVKD